MPALGVIGVLRALVRTRWSAWILILSFAAADELSFEPARLALFG